MHLYSGFHQEASRHCSSLQSKNDGYDQLFFIMKLEQNSMAHAKPSHVLYLQPLTTNHHVHSNQFIVHTRYEKNLHICCAPQLKYSKLHRSAFTRNNKRDPKLLNHSAFLHLVIIACLFPHTRRKFHLEWRYNLLICTISIFNFSWMLELKLTRFQIFMRVHLDNN